MLCWIFISFVLRVDSLHWGYYYRCWHCVYISRYRAIRQLPQINGRVSFSSARISTRQNDINRSDFQAIGLSVQRTQRLNYIRRWRNSSFAPFAIARKCTRTRHRRLHIIYTSRWCEHAWSPRATIFHNNYQGVNSLRDHNRGTDKTRFLPRSVLLRNRAESLPIIMPILSPVCDRCSYCSCRYGEPSETPRRRQPRTYHYYMYICVYATCASRTVHGWLCVEIQPQNIATYGTEHGALARDAVGVFEWFRTAFAFCGRGRWRLVV